VGDGVSEGVAKDRVDDRHDRSEHVAPFRPW
jgi:hypothetical protein